MSEEKIITQEHIITTIKLIKNYTQTHTHTLTHIIQNNLSKKKKNNLLISFLKGL